MDVRPHLAQGATSGPHGQVDYRLQRRRLMRQLREGKVTRAEVCDAHPELIRAARNIGQPTTTVCPVCEDAHVVYLTYAFGPRMPAQGKLVETTEALARLDRLATELACYTVEVCPACSWNHLARAFPIGKGTLSTVPGSKASGSKALGSKASGPKAPFRATGTARTRRS